MELKIDQEVSVLTLNHHPVNALALDDVERLTELLNSVPTNMPLVLTGLGPAFCAGVNVKAFEQYDGSKRAALVHAITRLVSALLSINSPVVAAVNGHALGGGFVLMLCGDYRIVANDPSIQLGLTEAQAGIPFPVGPLEVINAQLEPGLRRYLTLTSQTFSGGESMDHGIVDEIVDPAVLLDKARETAITMHKQPGFAAVKAQLYEPLRESVQRHVELSSDPLALGFLKGGDV